jgi:two-component system, cell cycle sensor histidine kinase PleC
MSPKIEESKNKRLLDSKLFVDAFLLLDQNLNLVDINDTGQRLFGLSEEAALGKCILDVMPNIRDGGIYKKYQHILKTRESIIIPFKLKDAQLIMIAFSISDYICIIVSDIIKPEHEAPSVRDAWEYATNIIDTVAKPLLVLDSDLRVVSASRSFCITFKVTPEETISQFIYELGNRQWDIPKLRELMGNILPKHTIIEGFEVEHDFPHIGRCLMRLNARRIHRKLNNSQFILLCIEDITKPKKEKRERELLKAELAEKTKELEEIIYTTSHDLRSPLVSIQGFTRELEQAYKRFHAVLNEEAVPPALRKRLDSALDGDFPLAFQHILASSAKMDSLLSGLLKLSRLGRVNINIEKLNMNKLVAEVISCLEFQVEEAGATVQVEDLPSCYGDEEQIDQVFSNLLGNALKFLDPKRPGIIRVSGVAEKEQVVYCVEDNGIGIAEKDKDKIFEIFHKLNPEDKRGEGLGLIIVRKILGRHGGKIWVESEPGKGSKFYVSLPDAIR